jgi:Uroporphyrinogen decarboxylase (URO-D)
MVSQAGPHELMKTILQGAAPRRPLFLPIVFSHAARIENLPLRAFLSNPTKITRALRQMRGHLRSDGLTCYFDPYLEIEALGAELDWDAGERRTFRRPGHRISGDLPIDAGALENLASKGHIPVAVEVIRRLKSMVRDDVLLATGVSGPLRLAAQLAQSGQGECLEKEISTGALELAAEATAAVAKAFVEAGANVVIISEDLPVSFPGDATVASLLATTVNIIRFYQSLPVLVLNPSAQPADIGSEGPLDCVVCPVASDARRGIGEVFREPAPATLGVAVPASVISEGQLAIEKFAQEFRRANPVFQPVVITTSGDVPDTSDLKDLNRLRDLLLA